MRSAGARRSTGARRSREQEQGAARCARAIGAITMLVAVRSAVEQALQRAREASSSRLLLRLPAEVDTNHANGRLIFKCLGCVSDAVGEALLEQALASCVAGADARGSRCLRWRRPRGRAARVGLPDVGEARQGFLETEVDERCHNRYSN